jgi:hypothetical protein
VVLSHGDRDKANRSARSPGGEEKGLTSLVNKKMGKPQIETSYSEQVDRSQENEELELRFRSCNAKVKNEKTNSTYEMQRWIFPLKSSKVHTTTKVTALPPSFF